MSPGIAKLVRGVQPTRSGRQPPPHPLKVWKVKGEGPFFCLEERSSDWLIVSQKKRNWKPKQTTQTNSRVLGNGNHWLEHLKAGKPASRYPWSSDRGVHLPSGSGTHSWAAYSPGLSVFCFLFWPSWPKLLSPQEYTRWLLSSSREWRSPLAACKSSPPSGAFRRRGLRQSAVQ